MTELAARNTRTQTIITNTDRIILKGIRKVISPFGHGTHEHADTLIRAQRLDIVIHPHNGGFKAERDFAAVGWQVVCDGVLDDAEQFFLTVCGADGEAVEELDHEACEALEGAGDPDGRADFDEHAFGGVDVDLESAGFIDG